MTVEEYLKEYANAGYVRMHMPGHKGTLNPYDITEVEHTALGDIARAVEETQAKIARAYGAETAFLLSGSTTGGILAAVHSCPSGRILVPRASHRSVWSACALFARAPIVLDTQMKEGLPLPPTAQEIAVAVRRDPDMVACVVTSPDYYGQTAQLDEIKAVLGHRTLIVDSAHGAHFGLRAELPCNACLDGDIVLVSAHKTLPSLTQTAIALVKRSHADVFQRSVALLSTTSPSYPLFASVESGVDRALNTNVTPLIEACRTLPLRVQTDDPLRIVLDANLAGITGQMLATYLVKNGIVSEFAGERYVVMIVTCVDAIEDLGYIADVLDQLPRVKQGVRKKEASLILERVDSFLSATDSEAEWIPLAEAVNRIAGSEVGRTPPCQPLIIRGEQYSKELIEILESATAFGVDNGRVLVEKKTCL